LFGKHGDVTGRPVLTTIPDPAKEDVMSTLSRRVALVGFAALSVLPVPARSQEHALKIVYPYPAGGSGDAIVRMVADYLQKSLGRPVVVENKTGAGGRIGAQAVKDAPPDGATLLFAAAAQFTLQPHVLANLGYDPLADFVPISRIVKFDQALVVNGQVPARSIKELAAWLKTNPDKAAFGSPGAGTGAHFAALEFGRTFGVPVRHVPYRGTPAALPDLLAGRLPIYVASAAELIEHHKSGGIRILATAGAVRSPMLADVPTLKESGVDIQAPGWFAFYAPAKIPAAMKERLEKEISAAANSPAIRARIEALGFQPTDTTARDLERVQRVEFDAWAAVVKASGFKAE
jgi:tripartite-type tricarboxylate transporter receptor subunit TctC